jgi:DNA-binding IclR family transcriptional regulator
MCPDPPPPYAIAVVERTLDVVEALVRVGPASLAAIASAAGCTRPAAFRILRTLQARGYAMQDGSRGPWRLGARWSAVAGSARHQGALAHAAQPYLQAAAATCGENAYLHVRTGLEGETIALHRAEPTLRVYHEIGATLPLHAGSGRLLLAHAPARIQAQLLQQRLPRYTPATRAEAGWIMADMRRIRARGWLITVDEVHLGTIALAAPVRDASGQVVAALAGMAPKTRMHPPRPRSLLPAVLHQAAMLSRDLGSREA